MHFSKFTRSDFAYGMAMAFCDKMSLEAIQNAVFNNKNCILNGIAH